MSNIRIKNGKPKKNELWYIVGDDGIENMAHALAVGLCEAMRLEVRNEST